MTNVWARMYHVELALNKRESQARYRAAKRRKDAAFGTPDLFWDKPEIADIMLPRREELRELSKPLQAIYEVETKTTTTVVDSEGLSGGEGDMHKTTKIKALEEMAEKLQGIINVLLTVTPDSAQHRALCEDQAEYLGQERDRVLAEMAVLLA